MRLEISCQDRLGITQDVLDRLTTIEGDVSDNADDIQQLQQYSCYK